MAIVVVDGGSGEEMAVILLSSELKTRISYGLLPDTCLPYFVSEDERQK